MDEQIIEKVGTGSLQSQPDYRYVNMEHLAGAAAGLSSFPRKFHIDFSQVPDLYQRRIGACTAHAATELRIHREFRATGQIKRYSPRFIYTLSKINDGVGNNPDGTPYEGTYCNMPLKMGVAFGFATEDLVPNDTSLAYADYTYHGDVRKIPQAAFDEADLNRIPGYVQIGKFNDISEAQLFQGLMNSLDGVKICLPVGPEWYTAKNGRGSWASADILPIRKPVNPPDNHDITVTGLELEDGTDRLKVFFRNHWSLNWADQDNGWFYFDEHVIREAWVITEIPDPILQLVKSLPSQKNFSYTWKTDLKPMMEGEDVRNLQIALKILGTFPFTQPVTTYYGRITTQAVVDFQLRYAVASPADVAAAGGVCGPKSRETLNSIFTR